MAGSGDVVLGATLMLGVTGTECEIGIWSQWKCKQRNDRIFSVAFMISV